MTLTRYTDYALRVLLYLSLQPDQKVSISEIARFYQISKDHLVKVVNHLGRLGYVKTLRGRKGGILLAHDPSRIQIGRVVRETEPHFDLVECFNSNKNRCVITSICNMRRMIEDAMDHFFTRLDEYTLADLVSDYPAARSLLESEPSPRT